MKNSLITYKKSTSGNLIAILLLTIPVICISGDRSYDFSHLVNQAIATDTIFASNDLISLTAYPSNDNGLLDTAENQCGHHPDQFVYSLGDVELEKQKESLFFLPAHPVVHFTPASLLPHIALSENNFIRDIVLSDLRTIVLMN